MVKFFQFVTVCLARHSGEKPGFAMSTSMWLGLRLSFRFCLLYVSHEVDFATDVFLLIWLGWHLDVLFPAGLPGPPGHGAADLEGPPKPVWRRCPGARQGPDQRAELGTDPRLVPAAPPASGACGVKPDGHRRGACGDKPGGGFCCCRPGCQAAGHVRQGFRINLIRRI